MAGKECSELTQVLSCLIKISFVCKKINTVSCFHAWAREATTQGPGSWTMWESQTDCIQKRAGWNLYPVCNLHEMQKCKKTVLKICSLRSQKFDLYFRGFLSDWLAASSCDHSAFQRVFMKKPPLKNIALLMYKRSLRPGYWSEITRESQDCSHWFYYPVGNNQLPNLRTVLSYVWSCTKLSIAARTAVPCV